MIGDGFRDGLGREMEGCDAGSWVRLRGEMGAVCWVERVLVLVERKRRKMSKFLQGRGGELGLSRCSGALSLDDEKRC